MANGLITREDAARELLQRRAGRVDFLEFLKAVWWKSDPLVIGLHTRIVARHLTQAVNDYLAGKSSFKLIMIPVRHGKSDLCSRAFPAYFLGRTWEVQNHADVILTGYGKTLVSEFSKRNKSIIESKAFRALFPRCRIGEGGVDTVNQWQIAGSAGLVNAAGIGGGIVGHGGNLIVIDDSIKNSGQAESALYRDKVWNSISQDVLTRRGDRCIVLMPCTPWHTDDPSGRVQKYSDEEPNFPKFETIRIPANREDADPDIRDLYKHEWLFPERYSDEWYEGEVATLGAYRARALFGLRPYDRGGNFFTTDRWDFIDHAELPDARFVRFWDLASKERQRLKPEPDKTAGILAAVTLDDRKLEHMWIADARSFQMTAPERDARIKATCKADGPGVRVGVEVVAGYWDTFYNLKKALNGMATVRPVPVTKDKAVRSEPLEGIMEDGRFHVVRGPWNQAYQAEFEKFPDGDNDDLVDGTSGSYHMLTGKKRIGNTTRADIGI